MSERNGIHEYRLVARIAVGLARSAGYSARDPAVTKKTVLKPFTLYLSAFTYFHVYSKKFNP